MATAFREGLMMGSSTTFSTFFPNIYTTSFNFRKLSIYSCGVFMVICSPLFVILKSALQYRTHRIGNHFLALINLNTAQSKHHPSFFINRPARVIRYTVIDHPVPRNLHDPGTPVNIWWFYFPTVTKSDIPWIPNVISAWARRHRTRQ